MLLGLTVNTLTFAHRVYLCVPYHSYNKVIISQYNKSSPLMGVTFMKNPVCGETMMHKFKTLQENGIRKPEIQEM
jgi:hypothetical protein